MFSTSTGNDPCRRAVRCRFPKNADNARRALSGEFFFRFLISTTIAWADFSLDQIVQKFITNHGNNDKQQQQQLQNNTLVLFTVRSLARRFSCRVWPAADINVASAAVTSRTRPNSTQTRGTATTGPQRRHWTGDTTGERRDRIV